MYYLIPKRNIYFFLIAVTIGFAIYSNSLDVPFFFDDTRNIKHPDLRIEELTAESVMNALVSGTLGERPISNLSFALNYYLHGYTLPGYHVANISLHVLTSFFLYLLLGKTVRLPVNRGCFDRNSWVIELAALLWLAHHLATQSVTYIVQRMNVLAAFFYIVSLYFFVVARSRQFEKSDGTSESKSWSIMSACDGLRYSR